ncbi:MAG: DUF4097 family beta strand repeat protein [Ruminococcus sp.]|nr:DUF4097 family beta strand repeat protein [Ruminococcus sp.]
MKKSVKISLIISGALIISGLLILFGALWTVSFDISKLDYTSYNTVNYKATVYDVDYDFTDIYIEEPSLDITFEETEDNSAYVRTYAYEDVQHQVYVENNKLYIKRAKNDNVVRIFGINIPSEPQRLTVCLPQKTYNNVTINCASSEVTIFEMKNIAFENLEANSTSGDVGVFGCITDTVKVDTTSGTVTVLVCPVKFIDLSTTSGNIDIKKVSGSESIKAKTTSGNLYMWLTDCNSLSVESVSGEIDLIDVTVSSLLNAQSTSGDINLENSDANELYIKTTSGDVEGHLLSKKTFVVDTTSGSVEVPQTYSNSKCEVHTVSGDVEFK